MDAFLNVIINILESFGYVYFIVKYLTIKEKCNKFQIPLLFFASFSILILSTYIEDIDQISLFIINVITFFICYYYSKNSIFEIIFILFFVETLIVISNVLSLLLNAYIIKESIISIYNSSNLLLIVSLQSKFVFCALCFLSAKIVKKVHYAYSDSILILLFMTVMAFFCLSNGFTLLITDEFREKDLIIFLLIISLIVILTYVVFNLLKKENYEKSITLLEYQELKNMRFYIEAVKSINDENQRLRHCLDNIALITKNRDTEINAIIKDDIKHWESLQLLDSKNAIMNNIFNTELILSEKKNISWHIMLESSMLEIDQLDCALFVYIFLKIITANIDGDKIACFRIREKSAIYIVSISFSYNQDLSNINIEEYINSINKIVNKYCGNIIYKVKDSQFECDVILKKDNRLN